MAKLTIFEKPIFWAITIFILAGLFRLTFPQLIEFKGDEAINVYEIEKFYAQPYLMQTGPIQSTGIYNPPLFFYVLTILAIPSRNPIYLSWIIGLINVVSIVGFYYIVRRYYGNIVGAISSLTLATSPWSILLSRKVWMPDLLMPLLVLYLLFLHQIIFDKKRSASLGLVISLMLMFQMHASGLFLAAATVVALLSMRVRVSFKHALIGLVIGLIPMIPYIARQFMGDEFCPDCSAFSNYSGVIKSFDPLVFVRGLQFTGGAFWDIVLGNDWPAFSSNPLVLAISGLFYLLLLSPLLSLTWLFKEKKLWFLPIILGLVPLAYFLTQTPAIMHYFIILSPIVAILTGLFWKYLSDSIKSPLGQKILIVVFGLIILANIIFEAYFFQFLSDKKVIDGDFGPIYPISQQKVNQAISKYSTDPDYLNIRGNAYIYAARPDFYDQMGQYFGQSGQPGPAAEMFLQAVQNNPQDITAQANLIYIYIQTHQLDQAQQQLDNLSTKESQYSPNLKQLLDQARTKSK